MLQSNAAELRRQHVKCVAPSCLSSMDLSTNSIFFLEPPTQKKQTNTQTKLNVKFGEWCVREDIVLLLHVSRPDSKCLQHQMAPGGNGCEDSVNLDAAEELHLQASAGINRPM